MLIYPHCASESLRREINIFKGTKNQRHEQLWNEPQISGVSASREDLGINIYLAKVFSSLLGKPTMAMKHLLASPQALQEA